MRTKVLGMALATLLITASAYADPIFNPGNHPQPMEQNVLFLTPQTGTMITTGHTNQSHTGVLFTSTTNTLSVKGGQSDVDDAAGGLLNDLTFSVPGHTFGDFILNPEKPADNGDLKVTVLTNHGTFTHTYGSTHGENFLTITVAGIESVTVDSAGGFQDLKQPRVSEISGVTVVPEPSSMLLLGSGLLGIAGVLRRKSS